MNDTMHKLLAYIELSRPVNGIIAFISVFLGAILASGDIQPVFNVLTIAVAALLLLSAGNAINDLCDVEIDQVNKPNRPIVSGRVSRVGALNFAFFSMTLAVCLGILVNWSATLLALSVALLLVSYAIWLKRTPFLGNLVVAGLTALIFLAGGIAINAIHRAWVPAIFAFLFTVAREIVKDVEDMDGDRKVGARTLPLVWGSRKAVRVAQYCMGLVIVISPFPYLLKWYGISYFIVVFFGVDLVLAYLMWRLSQDKSPENAATVQKWMKVDIFVGLLAMYLGKTVL